MFLEKIRFKNGKEKTNLRIEGNDLGQHILTGYNANGNLTISQEVLPASDNLTPIGICVIPTGFISTYSKARFISLKWMNNGTGSISVSGMNWGDVENLPLDIITYTFKNGEDNGFLTDYNPANKKTKLIPTLKTQDNRAYEKE